MAVAEVGPDMLRDCPDHGLPVEKVGAPFSKVGVKGIERVQRYRCVLGHVYDAPAED